MFYFNQSLNKCLMFVYGGCKGNANRFISIKDCENTCLIFDHKHFNNKSISRTTRFLHESVLCFKLKNLQKKI